MYFNEDGKITPVRFVQPLNVLLPMYVTFVCDKSNKPVKDVQFMAA